MTTDFQVNSVPVCVDIFRIVSVKLAVFDGQEEELAAQRSQPAT